MIEKTYYYVSTIFISFFFSLLLFPLMQICFLFFWYVFYILFIIINVFKFKVGEEGDI